MQNIEIWGKLLGTHISNWIGLNVVLESTKSMTEIGNDGTSVEIDEKSVLSEESESGGDNSWKVEQALEVASCSFAQVYDQARWT